MIDEESSGDQVKEDSEEEEEEALMEEGHAKDDDKVVCVGEVCFDKDGNLVEQRGNFCFHYPNCLVHRSPIFKDTH